MPAGTIADGVVKIVLAGYEAAKQQLAGLAGAAQKLNEPFKQIGAASRNAFGVAVGGILAFLRAADPVRFDIFTTRLKILGMYIGQAFIGHLDSAIKFVDKLIAMFEGPGGAALQKQIEHWTMIALKVFAAGAALGAIVATIEKVGGALGILKTVISALMGTGIVGLIAVLGGLVYAFSKTEAGQKMLHKLMEAMRPVIEALTPVLAKLGDFFAKAFEAAKPILIKVFDILMDAAQQIFPVLLDVIKACAPIVKALADAFVMLAPHLLKIFEAIGQAVISVLPSFVELFKACLPIIKLMAKIFVTLVESVTSGEGAFAKLLPVVDKIVGVFADLLAKLMPVIAELVKLGAQVLTVLIKAVADLYEGLWKAFGPTIVSVIKGVADVIKGIVDTVIKLVGVIDKVVGAAKKAGRWANEKLNPFHESTEDRKKREANDEYMANRTDEQAAGDKAYEEERWKQMQERQQKYQEAMKNGDFTGASKFGGIMGGIGEDPLADFKKADEARNKAMADYRAKQQEQQQQQQEAEERRKQDEAAEAAKTPAEKAGDAAATAELNRQIKEQVENFKNSRGDPNAPKFFAPNFDMDKAEAARKEAVDNFGKPPTQPAQSAEWISSMLDGVGKAMTEAVEKSATDIKNKPMAPIQHVESYGIEEGFRKAQQAAVYDPQKEYQFKLLENAKDQLDTARDIRDRVTPQVGAAKVG